MEIDLHGYHPSTVCWDTDMLSRLAQQAWEMGETELCLIHGHGRNRGSSPGFVNTNTGFLGLEIRRRLRTDTELRRWIRHTTLCCKEAGCTTVKLKPNPSPTRTDFDLPERDFDFRAVPSQEQWLSSQSRRPHFRAQVERVDRRRLAVIGGAQRGAAACGGSEECGPSRRAPSALAGSGRAHECLSGACNVDVFVILTHYMGGVQHYGGVFASMSAAQDHLVKNEIGGNPQIVKTSVIGPVDERGNVYIASTYDPSLDIHNFLGVYGSFEDADSAAGDGGLALGPYCC
jgi:hypothetical protein